AGVRSAGRSGAARIGGASRRRTNPTPSGPRRTTSPGPSPRSVMSSFPRRRWYGGYGRRPHPHHYGGHGHYDDHGYYGGGYRYRRRNPLFGPVGCLLVLRRLGLLFFLSMFLWLSPPP